MRLRTLLPLAIFAALVVLLAVGLGLNPREVPSPLIDKPAPAFTLPSLQDTGRRITQEDFKGRVTLFNVFASWCVACREEHPLLVNLSRSGGFRIVGLNYKDTRADAMRWLGRYGNPYHDIAFDAEGLVGIDYGVYGVPETYVIDKRGVIRYKRIGPITPQILSETILPLVERLRNEPA